MLARKLGVVVMELAKVKELMEDGASDRRVSLLMAVASTEDSQDTIQNQQSEDTCGRERYKIVKEIHGSIKE